ncbi:MAG: DNA-directed RNA polymerase subunit omega [Dissulfurimicrobium sp.]|uniref:DNA-directed RNA polymerase subunit omega n=1 Tax=Dissulfurimicrobium TaxID=1769732 RepID=UPI001EDAE805|nr:DNA-directed RNA polymerase subunit omega [Dissulfurimicrobium hydrothermale]UKL14488.1 DNA-directed RNA polymerase subunit omega [Dissulfurimicrobium hydrothermale]
MARITVEDCLEKVRDRFSLVYLAVERVKQLRKGAAPLVQCKNKEIVTALREIAAGKVTYENLDELGREAEEQRAYKSFQPEAFLSETPQ